MLPTLFRRYQSPREKHAIYYEQQLFQFRLRPINLLQVGIDSTLQSWLKFLQKSNIYSIDNFISKDPKDFNFLNQKRCQKYLHHFYMLLILYQNSQYFLKFDSYDYNIIPSEN